MSYHSIRIPNRQKLVPEHDRQDNVFWDDKSGSMKQRQSKSMKRAVYTVKYRARKDLPKPFVA